MVGLIRREWERKCDVRVISLVRVRGGCVRALLSHCCNFSARVFCFFSDNLSRDCTIFRGDRCGRVSLSVLKLRLGEQEIFKVFCAKLSVSLKFPFKCNHENFQRAKPESITYANLCSSRDSNRLAFYRPVATRKFCVRQVTKLHSHSMPISNEREVHLQGWLCCNWMESFWPWKRWLV